MFVCLCVPKLPLSPSHSAPLIRLTPPCAAFRHRKNGPITVTTDRQTTAGAAVGGHLHKPLIHVWVKPSLLRRLSNSATRRSDWEATCASSHGFEGGTTDSLPPKNVRTKPLELTNKLLFLPISI